MTHRLTVSYLVLLVWVALLGMAVTGCMDAPTSPSAPARSDVSYPAAFAEAVTLLQADHVPLDALGQPAWAYVATHLWTIVIGDLPVFGARAYCCGEDRHTMMWSSAIDPASVSPAVLASVMIHEAGHADGYRTHSCPDGISDRDDDPRSVYRPQIEWLERHGEPAEAARYRQYLGCQAE